MDSMTYVTEFPLLANEHQFGGDIIGEQSALGGENQAVGDMGNPAFVVERFDGFVRITEPRFPEWGMRWWLVWGEKMTVG